MLLIGDLKEGIEMNKSDEIKKTAGYQIEVKVDMYPETRKKKIDIGISNMKIFLQPYFLLMIGHFFKEGQPSYDPDSFDRPNVYNVDVEDASELQCKIHLNNGLLCINPEYSKQQNYKKTIAILTKLEYSF